MNNDKLNELAIKAGLISEEDGKFTRTYLNYEEKKFAELIIRECAEIATMNSNQWNSAVSFVLTHFGVEE